MAKVFNCASDFLHYPRDRTIQETFDTTSANQFSSSQYGHGVAFNKMHKIYDFPDHTSSYETYPPPASAISSTSATYVPRDGTHHPSHKDFVEPIMRHDTPSGSPSPGTSQTFEYPPSTLSSASGASANSTASSTDGSPFANATHILPYQEGWHESLQGLGIAPEIVNGENYCNDQLPPASFHDLMLENNKFANCVGEYGKIVSSFPLVSSVVSSVPPSSSRKFLPTFSSPLALDTVVSKRDTTIDSILEEANNRMQDPIHLMSPNSAGPTAQSPMILSRGNSQISQDKQSSSFQSPNTPASTVTRLSSPTSSPRRSGDQEKDLNSTEKLTWNAGPQSPCKVTFYDCRTNPSSPSSHAQDSCEKISNSFFSQSSGRFVAPLESSCWFPCYFLVF